MDELESSVAGLVEAYGAAVASKDVEAFMQLYDQGVRVFDAWDVWCYEGAAAWRQMVEQWFATLGSERVAVNVEQVRATGPAELAVVSAIVRYAGVSAEGQELRALWNRLTWVVRLNGGTPKIVHEHTSLPVGFAGKQAILHP